MFAAATAALVVSAVASADKPRIDPTDADGQTVYMIGVHRILDARDNRPAVDAHEELYLLAYRQPTVSALDTAGRYACWHPGRAARFVYHDDVVTGAPRRIS